MRPRVAAGHLALARRRTTRAAAYFGRGGIASWRSGSVDRRGWVAPDDGSPAVQAALSGLDAGTPVVFSTSDAPRAWTFRQVGDSPVVGVVVGTAAEWEVRLFAEARGAFWAAAAAAVAGAGVLVSLVW